MVKAGDLLTVKAVAEILSLKEMTVYKMIWAGDLPAVRVGTRSVRVRRADLDTIITPINEAVK